MVTSEVGLRYFKVAISSDEYNWNVDWCLFCMASVYEIFKWSKFSSLEIAILKNLKSTSDVTIFIQTSMGTLVVLKRIQTR